MGTWLGHAAPGLFFISFSIWWLIRSMQQYYSRQGNYTNAVLKHCCCRCGCFKNMNIEGLVVIFVAVLGVVAEIATGWHNNGKVPLGNIQHLTMYISYGMVALLALLIHHDVKFVPKGADYICLLMSLLIELILFLFHLHGREEVDIHLHMLLVYAIGGCIVSVAAEIVYKNSINATLSRCFFFLLQGTWFWQIAFVLYPPGKETTSWDLKDMENIMLITLIYSWHMIGCLTMMMIICGLVFWCCSPRCTGDYATSDDSTSLLPTHSSHSKKRLRSRNIETHAHEQTTAIMNGYNSVGSEEDDLFTSPS